MKMKLFAMISTLGLILLGTGCYSTVEGNSKAGVPWTRDSVVSRYERSIPQMVAVVKGVLIRNGQLVGDNTIAQTLHAKVDGRNVWVKFEDVDGRVTQMTVQARTGGGRPDLDLAIELDRQIAVTLTTGGR
ncbi:MAG: hypothetical protein H7X97_04755 [Opitutaceae bacterium]|nr:hypothetical protein [Verrucomicrobiales bacterium]